MKLLLTSAGIKNPSIHEALLDLLGKPIAESSALCIPTASYGHTWVTPEGAWRFISGNQPNTPMVELGWKSVGVLELTALSSIGYSLGSEWTKFNHAFSLAGYVVAVLVVLALIVFAVHRVREFRREAAAGAATKQGGAHRVRR